MRFLLVVLLVTILASCIPAAPSPATVTAILSSPTAAPTGPVATNTASPTATKTRIPSKTPTLPPIPSPTEFLVNDLLDWQPIPLPEMSGQFTSDGSWLAVQTLIGVGENQYPLHNLLAGKLGESNREIFTFPEGKTIAQYEWGSGLELVSDRLAILVGPMMGDTSHGYEVWLIDLESGQKTQVKVSDNALPGIALSERWLVMMDSTEEMSNSGERCIEAYALPGLVRQELFCTEDRINWPELSGDWLTYKRYAAGKDWETNYPTIETLNLVTGETYSTATSTRAVSLKIYTSESLIAWLENEQIVVWPRPSESQKNPDKVVFGSNWPTMQVCGDRLYYTANAHDGMELRSWQPDGTVRVLHRYRGTLQLSPADKPLPHYDIWEIQCGGGWVMFDANPADDLLIAKDGD